MLQYCWLNVNLGTFFNLCVLFISVLSSDGVTLLMDQNGSSFGRMCWKSVASISVQIFNINDLKYGHHLKQIINIRAW